MFHQQQDLAQFRQSPQQVAREWLGFVLGPEDVLLGCDHGAGIVNVWGGGSTRTHPVSNTDCNTTFDTLDAGTKPGPPDQTNITDRENLLMPTDTHTIARTAKRPARFACCISALLGAMTADPSLADWVEQGPGPTINGQTEGLKDPRNPVSGAINAIVPDPSNGDILYVGTVNGGVWKTTNAKDVSPNWTPLTDTQLPALSIASLASSPLNRNRLFAGTGSTSSNGGEGNPGFGVARSDDGGTSWKVLATDTFKDKRVTSIVPTAMDDGNVVLAANFYEKGGVYRSTDGGEKFERISGKDGSGLPDAGVSSLIADPAAPQRLYAAIPAVAPSLSPDRGPEPNSGQPGIYRSDNGGVTWSRMGTAPVDGPDPSLRILLSLHHSEGGNVLYAAVAVQKKKTDKSGKEEYKDVWDSVYRSSDRGANWTKLPDIPNVSPGAQASIHGALLADIGDPNAVYLSGDVQTGPANGGNISVTNPNALGCTRWSANVYRYNGRRWEPAVCKGANGTSPHADSRNMVFDADGNLLQANDGGIYRLVKPADRKRRRWVSVLGNLRLAETISAAYDPLSGLAFCGTQDNGSAAQTAQNDFSWKTLIEGDGGVVAVDSDVNGHPGKSIRYYTYAELGFFTRSAWNARGRMIKGSEQAVRLRVKGTGKPLTRVDDTVQFYNRYALNLVDPKRMLIGTTKLYESLNRGDLLDALYEGDGYVKALAYGGRRQGAEFADVLYAGTSSRQDPQPEDDDVEKSLPTAGFANADEPEATGETTGRILHRTNVGEQVAALASYKGSGVVDLAIDPQDYGHVFVVDDKDRIWASFDEGQSWSELTANLKDLLKGPVKTLTVKGADSYSPDTVLVAGGGYGVAQLRNPETRGDWATVDK
ncbi:WD40/YVTN/BNR-like repeat-containing protein [Methylococcus capsulatus]|nr:sialidase family protein [Methylococcus capsulatus]